VSNSPVALGETAVFTNTSTGAISYDWDFGDGVGTSTDQNPVYMYTQGETYTVTLTALNNLGCTATHQEAFQVIGFKIFLPLVARTWP
jgi:PKD repeat protein